LNHKCTGCLVGTHVLKLANKFKLGSTSCNTIGTLGNYCSCTEVSSDGFAEQPSFVPTDLDSVHIDESTWDNHYDFYDNLEEKYDIVIPTITKPQSTVTDSDVKGGNLYPTLYQDIFDSMLIDIIDCGWKRFNMRPCITHVGKYIYGYIDNTTIFKRKVKKLVFGYAYNLVNLEIETVSILITNILRINELLSAEGYKRFEDEQLDAIVTLAPIWIAAEYRFRIRREVKPPQHIMDVIEDECEGNILTDYSDYQAEMEEEKEKKRRADRDIAYVEYSYFVSSKSMNRNLWIGDSGASCHMTNSMDGMINVHDIDSPIQIGTGDAVKSTKIGDKRLRILQADGEIKDLVLKDCKYVPQLFTNLFSITKALDKSWQISNEGIKMKLTNSADTYSIVFDQVLRTESGAITAVEMVPRLDQVNVTLERGIKININKLHLLSGHACESTLRKTAAAYGLTLNGQYMVCQDCAVAKARQRNVLKETVTLSTRPGERFYMDISSTKASSFGGAKFWLLVVDHFTDYCWSAFLIQKSHLADRVLGFIRS
jgi:hypothetical protein